jgi:hypothetical protein
VTSHHCLCIHTIGGKIRLYTVGKKHLKLYRRCPNILPGE